MKIALSIAAVLLFASTIFAQASAPNPAPEQINVYVSSSVDATDTVGVAYVAALHVELAKNESLKTVDGLPKTADLDAPVVLVKSISTDSTHSILFVTVLLHIQGKESIIFAGALSGRANPDNVKDLAQGSYEGIGVVLGGAENAVDDDRKNAVPAPSSTKPNPATDIARIL